MDELDPNYEVSRAPDREAELHRKAWKGLLSADLAPLAVLLRSEFVIETTLRSAIADAIEGKSAACRIEGKRTAKGKPIEDPWVSGWRDLRIDAFVRTNFEEFSSKESAVVAAMEKFGLSRSAIFDACKRAAAHREKLPEKLCAVLDSNFDHFEQNVGRPSSS